MIIIRTMEYTIEEIFEGMTDGEKCHMSNKLYKEGYVPLKLTSELEYLRAREAASGDNWGGIS